MATGGSSSDGKGRTKFSESSPEKERIHRDEHSPPTKIPVLLQAPHLGPPAPFSTFQHSHSPLPRKLGAQDSSQVFLAPEFCLCRNSQSGCPANGPPDQAGSAPIASFSSTRSVRGGNWSQRVRGSGQPTPPLRAHPGVLPTPSQRLEPQVGSASALPPSGGCRV